MLTEQEQLLANYKRDYQSIKDDKKRLSTSSSQSMESRQLYGFFYQYSTSVYLENKGSVARDHLANERTYLAWLRTSLSTISVGIGLTQLFRLEKSMSKDPDAPIAYINGQMIGQLFVFISILFLIFAFIRFFHTQTAMVHGYFPASRSTILITSCTLLITMVMILFKISRQ